jgi:hypothetical protein
MVQAIIIMICLAITIIWAIEEVLKPRIDIDEKKCIRLWYTDTADLSFTLRKYIVLWRKN